MIGTRLFVFLYELQPLSVAGTTVCSVRCPWSSLQAGLCILDDGQTQKCHLCTAASAAASAAAAATTGAGPAPHLRQWLQVHVQL